jgi:hypothetical protein
MVGIVSYYGGIVKDNLILDLNEDDIVSAKDNDLINYIIIN